MPLSSMYPVVRQILLLEPYNGRNNAPRKGSLSCMHRTTLELKHNELVCIDLWFYFCYLETLKR
jgi:hypothetical protein